MKLIIAACFIVCCHVATAQSQKPDSMLRQVFNSIKAGDEEAFVKLFPDYEQMKAVLAEFVKSTKDSNAKKSIQQFFAGITEEKYKKEMTEEFRQKFQNIHNQFADKGIAAKTMSLDSVSYQIMADDMFGPNLKQATGTFYLKSNGAQYLLPFTDVVWSANYNEWFGISLKRVRKEWEKEDVFFDEVITDTVIVTGEEMVEPPPPPPPPPPPKPKAKIKSPAQKPKG